jgi:hypothetical protein
VRNWKKRCIVTSNIRGLNNQSEENSRQSFINKFVNNRNTAGTKTSTGLRYRSQLRGSMSSSERDGNSKKSLQKMVIVEEGKSLIYDGI